MRKAGLKGIVVTHPISGEVDVIHDFISGGAESLKAILAHPAQPTAVVCYTDYQAYGLIRAAHQLNLKLPEQLSIVGHGNMQLSEIVSPRLTTLRLPSDEVGQRALEMLLAMLEGEQRESELVKTQLIVRESTCRRDA
jgi:DNA-binding LacI/PurR family transcriptional regulator